MLKKYYPYIIIAFLVFVFMLPKFLNASFGLIDDGLTVEISKTLTPFNFQQVFGDKLGYSGRFVPLYFLAMKGISLFTFNPVFFYFVWGVILFGTSVLVFKLSKIYVKSNKWAILAPLFFIFNLTTVENFYHLGKPEVLLTFFMLLSVYFLMKKKLLLSIIFLPFAYAAKEVSFAILAGTFFFIIFKLLYNKKDIKPYVFYLGFNILFFFLQRTMAYFIGVRSIGEGYTSFYQINFIQIIFNFLAYLAYFINDFLYIITAAIIFLVLFKKEINPKQTQDLFLLLFISLSFFLIYLPWQFVMPHYLLPCVSLGVVFSLSVLKKFADKRIIKALLVFAGLVGVINGFTQIQGLDMWYRTNNKLISYVSTLPADSMVFVNLPPQHEFIFQMKRILSFLYNRNDIVFVDNSRIADISFDLDIRNGESFRKIGQAKKKENLEGLKKINFIGDRKTILLADWVFAVVKFPSERVLSILDIPQKKKYLAFLKSRKVGFQKFKYLWTVYKTN